MPFCEAGQILQSIFQNGCRRASKPQAQLYSVKVEIELKSSLNYHQQRSHLIRGCFEQTLRQCRVQVRKERRILKVSPVAMLMDEGSRLVGLLEDFEQNRLPRSPQVYRPEETVFNNPINQVQWIRTLQTLERVDTRHDVPALLMEMNTPPAFP